MEKGKAMFQRRALLCVCAAVAIPVVAAAGDRAARVEASSGAALREWSGQVDRLLASGDLAVRRTRDDTMIPGRRHERLAQLHRGVPVFGGELVRQTDASGTLTVFGTFYDGIDVDVVPRLSPGEIEARLAARGGRPFGSRGGPELVVLPLEGGGYRLVYRVRAFFEESLDVRQSFLDAATGEVLREYGDIQKQAAGTGTGVLGDPEKVSVTPGGSGFTTNDRLRPPAISTYDFRFNLNRLILFLNANGSPANLTASDLGTDADNVWTDGALVDAHVFAGFVYDYYYKRFGRRGLDNANIAMHSITHALRREDWRLYSLDTILTFFANAFYLGEGVMYYGDGLPPTVTLYGQHVNYLAGALDVVAHELTHGVTDYTSQLIYEGEPGALNEAFSDMMATGVEFYFQPDRADYLGGEDVFTPGGIRSLQNPMAFGDPDHYSIRYTGSADNGGVHINSGIANNAFYLAIEGGRHRLGATVQGVGAANREQIERVFYRGFTSFLPPSASFSQARAATIQAARELYGQGSPAETAVTQAWNAVGVN
jgi:bacillolysin